MSKSPWVANNNTILTVTDELWIIAVKPNPTNKDISGLLMEANKPTTCGSSLNPFIAPDIVFNPVNKIPNPKKIAPIFLVFSLLENITASAPPNTKIGATSDKLIDTNCDVIVVPILAPKITPTA